MDTKNNIKNLAVKMVKIMGDVSYIQKSGYNSFHKYRYATDADVALAFSESLKKNKVCMFSSVVERTSQVYQTRGNKNAFLVTVKLDLTFVDADSGESFTVSCYGDGSDADDKAIYKAITGAQKYALLKTFLVATGDDPEVVETPPEVVDLCTAKQRDCLNDLLVMDLVEPKEWRAWIKRAGVTKFEEMTSTQIAGCIRVLEKKRGQAVSEFNKEATKAGQVEQAENQLQADNQKKK